MDSGHGNPTTYGDLTGGEASAIPLISGVSGV